MDFKGTKGKWQQYDNFIRADYIGSSFLIAEVSKDLPYPFTREMEEANAKLIASSPILLSTLQKISSIENAAFGLKSFDVVQFKKDVNKAIAKALE